MKHNTVTLLFLLTIEKLSWEDYENLAPLFEDGLSWLTGVRSCYDEGKRVAETLMFDYHRQHGIGNFYVCFYIFNKFQWIWSFNMYVVSFIFWTEIRIARIFNTYGSRMNIDDGRVVSNFIAQAVRYV